MASRETAQGTLAAYRLIPGRLASAVEGLGERTLELRGTGDGLSIRETVHHLAEANLVATSILIAALGSPGCTYDWSWMQPFGSWLERLRYDRLPIEPALRALEACNGYLADVIASLEDCLSREVLLRDAAGEEPRRVTVDEVLQQEVTHAEDHLERLAATRRTHGV